MAAKFWLSVWQTLSILEDNLKNKDKPKNDDGLRNEVDPKNEAKLKNKDDLRKWRRDMG